MSLLIPATGDGFRRNNFDFLRFALASLVILSHSFALLHGNDRWEPLSLFSGRQSTFGGLAVEGFFVLSGFLIAASWARSPGFGAYALNRVLRIYPAFVVCLLICLFVIGPSFVADRGDYLRRFIPVDFVICVVVLNFYNLKGTFPTNPVAGTMNGSMWTIPHEMVCYLLLPLLAMGQALRRRGLLLTVWFATWCAYAGGALSHNPVRLHIPFTSDGPAEWMRLITFFLTGVIAYQFRDTIPRSQAYLAVATAVWVAGLRLGAYAVVAPACVGYTLLYTAYSPRLGAFNFGKYGDCSYGMYIYAFPIQQVLIAVAGVGAWHPVSLFLVATAITALVAMLSWHLVEKRFMALKHRALRPSGAAPLPAGPPN